LLTQEGFDDKHCLWNSQLDDYGSVDLHGQIWGHWANC
jgi:hypothetical protein